MTSGADLAQRISAKPLRAVYTPASVTAMNTDHTFKVTCDCGICEINAAKIGQPFPLAAMIRPLAAKNLGVTAKNANKAAKVHGFVYAAHDPSQVSLPASRRFAIPA